MDSRINDNYDRFSWSLIGSLTKEALGNAISNDQDKLIQQLSSQISKTNPVKIDLASKVIESLIDHNVSEANLEKFLSALNQTDVLGDRDFLEEGPYVSFIQNVKWMGQVLGLRSKSHDELTKNQMLTNLCHQALARDKTDLATLLIKYVDSETFTGNYEGGNLLADACEAGNEHIVQFLLENGVDVNSASKNRFTPLMIACEQGQKNIIPLLIKHGANINPSISKQGEVDTPLTLAYYNGFMDIAKELIKNGADIDSELIWACVCEDADFAEFLISQGADVNYLDKRGDTPLTVACKLKCEKAAMALLENGADVNATNDVGNGPLSIACYAGLTDLVVKMIESGADLNFEDQDQMTPLKCAMIEGQSEIFHLLLEAGADVSAVDKTGKGLLEWVCDHLDNSDEKISFASALVEKGANIRDGNVARTHFDVVQMVLLDLLNDFEPITSELSLCENYDEFNTLLRDNLDWIVKYAAKNKVNPLKVPFFLQDKEMLKELKTKFLTPKQYEDYVLDLNKSHVAIFTDTHHAKTKNE